MLRVLLPLCALTLLILSGCGPHTAAAIVFDDATPQASHIATTATPSPAATRAATATLAATATASTPAPTATAAAPPAAAIPPQGPAYAFPTAIVLTGPPGPNTLVYQGFWAGTSHGDLHQTAWNADPTWTTNEGMLVTDGSQPAPVFATPFLGGNAMSLVLAGNYVVEAQMAADKPDARGAFGVYVRGSAAPSSMPPLAVAPGGGLWRAGVALGDGRAFILGEQRVPGGQTPADLLVPKALDSVEFSPGTAWVTLRFEARDTHYTLAANGRTLIEVDDARYTGGTDIGVWADSTPVKVRDFRLYTLP